MATRQRSQGLVRLDAILLGIGVAAVFVLINGFAALNFVPSSYERFSWQAYAETVYTNTPTPTATATPTPTPTTTPTGSVTPSPTGSPTITPTNTPTFSLHENSGGVQGCSDQIDNDGDGLIDCQDPDCMGVPPCGVTAPAMSNRALGLMVALFALIGFFALTPLRFGKRR